MAVKWSWAWGSETALQLRDDMGWSVTSTISGNIAPTSAALDLYTYTGSGPRFSIKTMHWQFFSTPAAPFIPTGIITAAIRANDNWALHATNAPILRVHGNTAGANIEVRSDSTGGATMNCTLYVNGNASLTTFQMHKDTWYYLALKYDMSADPWIGELYVNGTSRIGPHSVAASAETSGYYASGGFSLNQTGITAQMILYDQVDLADAIAPIFCSRAAPNDDGAEVGSWVPSAGPDNYAVTNNDPLNLATYTEETTPPSSADSVITEVDNLATQLGVPVGSTVLGATNHTYSTGTGATAFAGIADTAPAAFVDGATIILTSATTYATATVALSSTAASVINCRYKIT